MVFEQKAEPAVQIKEKAAAQEPDHSLGISQVFSAHRRKDAHAEAGPM